eukprot:3584823-Ditylum_brightwellii.AAC.1
MPDEVMSFDDCPSLEWPWGTFPVEMTQLQLMIFENSTQLVGVCSQSDGHMEGIATPDTILIVAVATAAISPFLAKLMQPIHKHHASKVDLQMKMIMSKCIARKEITQHRTKRQTSAEREIKIEKRKSSCTS